MLWLRCATNHADTADCEGQDITAAGWEAVRAADPGLAVAPVAAVMLADDPGGDVAGHQP
ncbi:hypothetical protein ACWERY_10825 [Streptomyces sp. NPDC004082]|uniref:hypothetical protein n=1 Tax=unclassified Streptomyces TaxID=2593676 RepID=UPI0033A4958B